MSRFDGRPQKAAQTERLLTPANVVTFCRILLVPVFVVAFLSPWPEWFGITDLTAEWKSLIAAAIFIIISCTDWVDGYLARSRGEVTDFGKFMDPLADKILVAAALLALVEQQVLPSWPVLIILAREFIVSGVRMVAASKGEVIAASWYGKAKTVLQILAIILFLVKDFFFPPQGDDAIHNPLYLVSWAVMLAALVLTIASMIDYLVKARGVLGIGKGAREGSSDEPSQAAEELSVQLPAAPVEERNHALASLVVERASERGLTVATAESLTGGLIASALTAVPGSSIAVRGSVVSYATAVKHEALGVDEELLAQRGPVDEEVALQMARGACRALSSDVAVAVTGIAGPGGAEPGKPVGTVWMALSSPWQERTELFCFSGDRSEVREQTVSAALEGLFEACEEAPSAVCPLDRAGD